MLEMTLSHQLQAAPGNGAAESDPGVKYPSSWAALCFPHAVLGRVMLHLPCWVGSPFSKYFLGFSGISLWLPHSLAGSSHIPLLSLLPSVRANALHKGHFDPVTAAPCVQQAPVSLKPSLLSSGTENGRWLYKAPVGFLYSFFSLLFQRPSSEFSWTSSGK